MRAIVLIAALGLLLGGCSEKYVYVAPSEPVKSATQLRMRMADSHTLSHHLEQEKRYSELRLLLHRELNQLELVGRELALGILPNDLERKRVDAAASSQGDAAWQAFHRDNLINHSPKRYDPEGELFLLDDLAHLYSYWLVDFTRAEHYNQRARDALQRVRGIPLSQLPLSPWFNDRRQLYYTFFISSEALDQAGYQAVPGHPNHWTLFPPSHLDKVRGEDINRVARRIEERERFIAARLGDTPLAEASDTPNDSIVANLAPLLQQYADFLSQKSELSPFERRFLVAAQARGVWQQQPQQAQREALLAAIHSALQQRPSRETLASRHALNLLHYWRASSELAAGNTRAGIAAHSDFMQGIDALEAIHTERANQRTQLVETLNLELKEKAEGDRNKALVMVALALAGGAYTANRAHQQGLSYNPHQQTFQDMSRMSGQILFSTHDLLNRVRERAETSKAVVRYISPYALKLNRYLDKYQMSDYLLALGRAYQSSGDRAKAVEQYAEVARIIERQRSTIASESQRISFFATRQDLYSRLIPLLVSLGRHAEALEYAERARSRAFVDMLGGTRLKLADAQSQASYRSTLAKLAEVDILLSESGISADQLAQLADRAERGGYAEEAPVPQQPAQSVARQGQLRALARVETRDAAQIRAELPADGALLEYFLGDGQLTLLLATPSRVRSVVVAQQEQPLIDTLLDFRAAILEGEAAEDVAAELYDLLIAPALPLGLIDPAIKRLIVVPHGPLHYLPFAALHDGQQHLIKRFAISYAPSATALALTRANSASNTGALLVGNPTGDLRFAAKEAEQISQIVSEPRLLLGEAGTEGELKHNASGFGLIHLATHGEYNPVDPLASRIRLAPGMDEDGSLTTAELFALRWDASLVNLSACQTGLSRNLSGDELIGLQRGIFFAGARSLIASLWSVDDRATGELMTRFYRHLEAGEAKDLALQRAQLETRKTYPEPYFWAAFGLSGASD